MMAYEFSEVNIANLDSIYDLTVKAGLNSNRSKSEWIETQSWLCQQSQNLTGISAPIGHVMYDGSALMGFVGYSYRMFKSDGKIYAAIVLNDLVIHPDHRGVAGIILCKNTIKYFQEHSSQWKILGLHHSQSAAALWKALGASDVPSTGKTFSAVTSSTSLLSHRYPFLRHIFKGFQIIGGPPLISRALANRGKPIIQEGSLHMVSYSSDAIFDEGDALGIENLLRSFSVSYETGVLRDLVYLKWRYAEHPLRSFHWYGIFSGSTLVALAVAQIMEDGYANLCDLFFDPQKIDGLLEGILRAVLFSCGKDGNGFVRSKIITPPCSATFMAIGLGEDEKKYNQFWVYPPQKNVGKSLYTFGDNKVL